ncbi:MAG: WYL domain-containing protein [Myxococcales bacterium]|nr:WYL domain-containing protein [Myxococcales bacterium]
MSGSTDGHERLRRLLFLVPFVSRNPGRTVDEIAKELGTTREALLEELDLLTLVGRPPFQPDDFVDIYVEDDRVYVDLDQRLSAPPRLTAAEGVALAASATLLKPGSGDALRSAIEKLERVLPAHAVTRFREMGKRLDVALDAPTGLAPLSQAIVERRTVAFDYVTTNSGQAERRRVQPVELFSHRGQWYLSGFDVTRAGDRLFRLDRMGPLEVTTETFVAPEGSPRASMPGTNDATERVTVRFEPATAPYIRERFGAEVRGLADGRVEVEVPGDNVRWLTRWVLSFGGDAIVTSPEWAIRSVAEVASASLE